MEREYQLYSKTETAQLPGIVQCNFMPKDQTGGMSLLFNVPAAEAATLVTGDQYVMTMKKKETGEALSGTVDTQPIPLES